MAQMPVRNINIYNESSLHADLKSWYAHPGDLIEVPVGGYIIDIKRADLLIEIQNRNFYNIKKKLSKLLLDHHVHLVHPIAEVKWITKLTVDESTISSRRKSPKKGRPEQVFVELVRIPEIIRHPNFSLETIMIEQEEIRINDGKGSWRRQGWSIVDHKLIKVNDRISFESPQAYRKFIPSEMAQPFTNRELSEFLSISQNLAQKMVYCLRKMDLIKVIGKKGRSNLHLLIE